MTNITSHRPETTQQRFDVLFDLIVTGTYDLPQITITVTSTSARAAADIARQILLDRLAMAWIQVSDEEHYRSERVVGVRRVFVSAVS